MPMTLRIMIPPCVQSESHAIYRKSGHFKIEIRAGGAELKWPPNAANVGARSMTKPPIAVPSSDRLAANRGGIRSDTTLKQAEQQAQARERAQEFERRESGDPNQRKRPPKAVK
jgi:hypothetical protein